MLLTPLNWAHFSSYAFIFYFYGLLFLGFGFVCLRTIHVNVGLYTVGCCGVMECRLHIERATGGTHTK